MPERNCLLLYLKRKKAANCQAGGFSFFVLEHCASFAPSVSTGSMPVKKPPYPLFIVGARRSERHD